MIDIDVIDSTFRCKVVALCRDSKRRQVARNMPCRWYVDQVTNPETKFPFSTASAWEFVADTIEAGTKIEKVDLIKLQPHVGYEIVVTMPVPDGKDLYIKFMVGNGFNNVIGLSFHYSTVTGK